MMTYSSPTATPATPASASSSSTADTRWVSVHLYYHDALDDLLRGAVRPLVGKLAARKLIDGFFFVRYWQGGPHARLRVRLRDQAQTQLVERLIEARIGRFFACHPSQTVVRAEDYLRAAGRLAQHEFGFVGPVSGDASPDSHRHSRDETVVEPLQPNNSLRYVAYVPEEDRLGGPAGVAAFEPHFMDSAAIALDVIAANPSGQRRTGRTLAMMLLAAAVVLPDPQRLARFFRYSYRNWATRNAAGDPDRRARYEAQFEQQYQRQCAQLSDVAQRLRDQARPGVGTHLDAISTRWMASVAVLADRLTSQRSTGVESLLFQCLHKHNNRLGVKVAEETYLLFLLQRTLTEIA
ncbi:MAG: thiopeptide-type bacteriocin biosynthesis protein [Pseudonocardiaceae bacterium]